MSANLLLAQVLLLVLGTLAVGTADPENLPDQAFKAVLAILITVGLSQLRPKVFLKLATPAWLVSLVLLVLVFFIGHGTATSSGTKRWLFSGIFQFQPSEFAKLSLILMLASFFARRGVYRKLISATGMIALTTLLVLIEPDLGTTVLMFSLGIVLMYAAGVRFTNITALLFALALLALPILSIYLERNPYILERFLTFISRDKVSESVAVKGLDQIGMAHRDLSFGGIWGQGPEAPRYPYFADHTDLAIASVGFSTGLLGVTMVLFAYWLVVSTALQVAQLAARVRPMTPNLHGASIMATGAMYMIVGQAFVNLAVAAGIFPVTGVPLPLVSYGFSSMLSMSIALAIIHSALREVKSALPQEERTPELIAAD
ncbi:FtsW/RodA/SpoVE family cell cycle protein [Deinococcus psychrotolerans]|uniref:FtsW/RodA/SpoVE family cell cycle protein n=1 Tax=Deinococcus psychrotolerans TaxID=2489213 RepID=A0A3G8YH05_9DEIO|nr:FtsW/RodA/SpoVE family cell cycle protein [Deinococcus psychrotolerans]AZI43477.1 FtsW/RodA/SpoVE family cell cycle protein [Deinococcus psychrotolerans]